MWTNTLSSVLADHREQRAHDGGDEGAEQVPDEISDSSVYRALRRMWPLSSDDVPSTSGVPLADVILPRDRRRRRKALRRAASAKGLEALVLQGLAEESALEAAQQRSPASPRGGGGGVAAGGGGGGVGVGVGVGV